MGVGDFFRDLGREMDNFIDDAMDRKLGGGSTFYGERKSSFGKSNKSYQEVAKSEADKRDLERIGIDIDFAAAIERGGSLTGEELRDLIVNQWGQQFPVLIKRRRDALGDQRLYLIIQWKYLGKRNLNLSEDEYIAESDAVAELVTEWGVANMVKNAIQESTAKPKTMTQQYPGLFIPLEVDRNIVKTW
eukprot:CAMPEP_0185736716 /NCGR_PEP_ID=MMETSP1171-20130828/28614_1 /TAXON_ID=374046 /ORGANISM="Helicotheca tamensis, Strain CCMP826" /LENGTH=188 /DNA_ID=CAMNT_0028407421 /DNA_START=115 /DNA_END=678 /DNA_ORIENTATION=+